MIRYAGYQEDPHVETLDLGYLARLWPFVRPYRRAFAGALAILAVSFGIELVGPWLLKLAIDGPIAAAVAGRPVDLHRIFVLGAGYLGATATAVALGYGYALLTAKNGQRVIRDVRLALFDHILRLGPRFFETNPAGKLVTRCTSDVENLNELISTGVLQSMFDLLKIVGVLVALFLVDVRIALLIVLGTPLVIVISLVFRRYVRRSYRRVRGALARQNALTAEALGGMRITRAFGREAAIRRAYGDANANTRQAWLETVLYFAMFMSLVDGALHAVRAAMLAVGGAQVLAGTLSAGVFVQAYVYFGKLSEPIRELGEKYNVLQSAFSSCERIFHILDEPRRPAEPRQPLATTSGPARLTFDAVSFGYQPGVPVLREVSFEVRPGETTALVGPTGAGKTTILKLVSRLYDPDHGAVRLDGIALPCLEADGLRRRIAVVPQEVFLFTGTVLDNVRLFDDTIDETRVWQALDAVGARHFVERLDGGLRAPVEERGATFSQGERQLLSFARALVRQPDLLVLDEATASIDSHSEAQIQQGLHRLMAGRSCLVVAHRLSTVREAHQILVVQGGRVVERGAHPELVRGGGVYARMVHAAS